MRGGDDGGRGSYSYNHSFRDLPDFDAKPDTDTDENEVASLVVEEVQQHYQLAEAIHHDCTNRYALHRFVLFPK